MPGEIRRFYVSHKEEKVVSRFRTWASFSSGPQFFASDFYL